MKVYFRLDTIVGVYMVNNEVARQVGWLDRIKETLNLKDIMDKFELSKNTLIELGLYCGIGFLSGFLLKKYGSYVFIVVLMIVGLIVLQQFDIVTITVNWNKVQEVFGIQPTTTLDTNVLTVYWEWVKLNFAIVLSFSVGFLIGLKVG